jgi:hypothetical protein
MWKVVGLYKQVLKEEQQTIATSTRCIYVVTNSNSSGLKDFNGSLMC